MKSWKANLPPFRRYKIKVFENAAKTGQFIYQIGESEDLRKPSKEVLVKEITSKTFQKRTKYLKDCLIKYRKFTGLGRGITAVQVGIPERFSVIYTPQKLILIINPKIVSKSKKLLKYPEMCMSANPIIVPTIRPSWIQFEYLDEKGSLQKWDIKDSTEKGRMMNRVFQHEIDHMDGIVNLDKGDPKEFILESDPKFYKKAIFEKA